VSTVGQQANPRLVGPRAKKCSPEFGLTETLLLDELVKLAHCSVHAQSVGVATMQEVGKKEKKKKKKKKKKEKSDEG
jgi:hypothetical protein